MPFITTQQNEKIHVLVKKPQTPAKGVLFLMHGLGSASTEKIIQATQKAYADNGWTSVAFDCRHAFGKSSGSLEKARLSTYFEDLNTVIDWAQKQDFFIEPFGLAGHSLGGAAVLKYAEHHSQRVNHLVLIAPVLSGKLWEEACLLNIPDFYREWQKNGSFFYQDPLYPDWKGSISYDVLKDTFSYDAFSFTDRLKMPVSIFVGQNDAVSLVSANQQFYDRLHGFKMIRLFKEADHTLRTEQNAVDLGLAVSDFLNMTADPKKYYTTVFEHKIIPAIIPVSNQPRYGYHGISHTEQVGLFALDYALTLRKNPLPVLWAAGLHDYARTNDAYDETNGPRCVPLARKFLKAYEDQLTPTEIQQILYAVEHHTTGRQAPDYVAACLWDADRTRLSWERGYQADYFTTARAKEVAALDDEGQNAYLKAQQTYLMENGLKTKQAYEKEKNSLMTMIRNKGFKQQTIT